MEVIIKMMMMIIVIMKILFFVFTVVKWPYFSIFYMIPT